MWKRFPNLTLQATNQSDARPFTLVRPSYHAGAFWNRHCDPQNKRREKSGLARDPWHCFRYFALLCAAASSVAPVPKRVSRGKKGVTSNGILSRTDVIATGAAFTIST